MVRTYKKKRVSIKKIEEICQCGELTIMGIDAMLDRGEISKEAWASIRVQVQHLTNLAYDISDLPRRA